MINCTEVDIPDDFKEFFKIMLKHKSEGNTLLMNIHDHWYTAEIRRIHNATQAIDFKVHGYDTMYVYNTAWEKDYRNTFKNSTYVIEDMFYRIAHAHS